MNAMEKALTHAMESVREALGDLGRFHIDACSTAHQTNQIKANEA